MFNQKINNYFYSSSAFNLRPHFAEEPKTFIVLNLWEDRMQHFDLYVHRLKND